MPSEDSGLAINICFFFFLVPNSIQNLIESEDADEGL